MVWQSLLSVAQTYGRQVVEIVLASVIFYYILLSVRGTKTAVLVQGLIVLGVFYAIATYFRLIVISMILNRLLFIVPIALIIIFVPEIRRFLERAGRTNRLWAIFFPLPSFSSDSTAESANFDAIVNAVEGLAHHYHGALIAVEHQPIENDLMVIGTWLDASISETALRSIFEPHNPLHDGAVVLRGDRILYAGCFFPLTIREDIDRDLGTRHRAALGVTEKADCFVIVVSEERGKISIAHGGRLVRDLSPRQFREQLRALYFANPNFSTMLPAARM